MRTRIKILQTSVKNAFLLTVIFLLAILIRPSDVKAQQTLSLHPVGYTVEKHAESQTKWMTQKLSLSSKLAEAVYKINLKYLLQTDLLCQTTTETVNKRNLHLAITQRKNAELQSVLSTEQYSKYQAVFANAKRYSR